MSLQLKLQKPGETVEKLHLNLNKGEVFTVVLSWDTDYDLDAHALETHNDGNGAKVSDYGQILSTYNCDKTNKEGHLHANNDGSFSTSDGALIHSPDILTGQDGDGEYITIDSSKLPSDINEIPIFITIHPSHGASAKFTDVKHASIIIKDSSNKELGSYNLSSEFGKFNAVQMGSLIHDSTGWQYAPVGSGFNGDFNTILGFFS